MYEIGPFIVYGGHEPEPTGLAVRIVPYAEQSAHPWWGDSTRRMIEAMPEVITPGMRVLDFGCGASAILAIAAAKLGATPYPVEIHPIYAVIAQRQFAANGLGMTVEPEPRIESVVYDFALVNVGDAALVGKVSRLAAHGIGTDREGELLRW